VLTLLTVASHMVRIGGITSSTYGAAITRKTVTASKQVGMHRTIGSISYQRVGCFGLCDVLEWRSEFIEEPRSVSYKPLSLRGSLRAGLESGRVRGNERVRWEFELLDV
jgi:hypothetical protein